MSRHAFSETKPFSAQFFSAQFFSALRFYALATGSPLDHSRALVTLNCNIPPRGTLLIPPDPRGESELAWNHGVATLSEQRERFVDTIRAGEIPSPLAAFDVRGECPRVLHHPLELLHAREQTVASLLGLTKPLVAAASRSPWARCPGCAQSLPIFHTATDLHNILLTTLRDKNLRIDIVGAPEDISPWATEQGFTIATQAHRRASVRVDSLTCSPEALQKLAPLLSSTKHLPNTWLTVTHENAPVEYGWNGRCARCDLTLSSFNTSTARDLVERPLSSQPTHEGCRLIDQIPLIDLLSLPIVQILNGPTLRELLSPLQRDAIQALPLESLKLNSLTTDLAPQTLALVALLDLARVSDAGGKLRLFTAPASLFSEVLLPDVQALIEKLSANEPFIWISEAPRVLSARPSGPSATRKTRCLGSISLQGQTLQRVEVECGRLVEIIVPPTLKHLRVAALVHKALAGKASEIVSSECTSPLIPFLAPLFPSEPSGTRLIAHALGVIEPLSKMFAASHQAKMLGLTARDFLLGQVRQVGTVCAGCRGTGVLIEKGSLHSAIEPCHTCWGARFRSPAREVTFKGRTLWEILNASLSTSEETLRALPKMKEVFELASMLGITELPLGMPVTLLSTPQRRLLAIAHAMLSGTKARPSVIVIEEPIVGLSGEQRAGLEAAVTDPTFEERVSWIGVSGREADHGPE